MHRAAAAFGTAFTLAALLAACSTSTVGSPVPDPNASVPSTTSGAPDWTTVGPPSTRSTNAATSTGTTASRGSPAATSTTASASEAPLAYRQGYQAARQLLPQVAPKFTQETADAIVDRCESLTEQAEQPPTGAARDDWMNGCLQGAQEGSADQTAVQRNGASSQTYRQAGYQVGRQYHADIENRQNGDIDAGCRLEAHFGEVDGFVDEFVAGCRDGYADAKSLALPNGWRESGESARPGASSTRTTVRPTGDLGLTEMISRVPCDGRAIVLLGSAATPSAYTSDVQKLLQVHPGSHYLRTDQACGSLTQRSDDGHRIYAVFYGPYGETATACEVLQLTGGDAQVRVLTDSAKPLGPEQC